MSNRSRTQRRAQQRSAAKEKEKIMSNFGEKITKALEEAAKDIKKKEVTLVGEQPSNPDLNILPLPTDQEIQADKIVWTWQGFRGAYIESCLYLNGPYAGQYQVELSLLDAEGDVNQRVVATLNGDQPKEIGQALVSAWNWKNVWKQHAGHLLEQQLVQPATVVETPTNVSPLKAPAKKAAPRKAPAKKLNVGSKAAKKAPTKNVDKSQS